MSALLDYTDIANRYGFNRRYVRDTLTKRPCFPAPAFRISNKAVRWNVRDIDKYFAQTGKK